MKEFYIQPKLDEQKKIINRDQAKLDDLLDIPIAIKPNWSENEINKENYLS